MDKKLKVKYRKNEDMYIVDYLKTKDKLASRFELLGQLSKDHDLFLAMDSSLGKINKKDSKAEYLDIGKEEVIERLKNYLTSNNYEYKFRTVRVQRSVTILGLSMGKSETVEEQLIAVSIPKGKLTKEFFDLFLCTHDYMLGIDPTKEASVLLREFSSGDFTQIEKEIGFKDTLVDSHLMGYFYTSYKFNVDN